MVLILSRFKIYTTCVLIAVSYVVSNRINYYLNSTITTGEVVEIKENRYSRGNSSTPKIKFIKDSSELFFYGLTNLDAEVGDTVKVIYKKDLSDSNIFSFSGFLYMPFLYCSLFILIVVTPPIFSLMTSRTYIILDFKQFGKGKIISKTIEVL